MNNNKHYTTFYSIILTFWSAIKSAVSSDVRASRIQYLKIDGEDITSSKKILASFAAFFKPMIANLRQPLPVPVIPSCSPQLLTDARFGLSQITKDFVYKQLKALDSKKSSGLPDIPIRLDKDGAEALARPLTLLMNKTINEGSLPVDWKHAGVKPVHKAGSKSDPLNYLPISVWSVHRMVYSYLQSHRIRSLLQSGFRPLHSTSTCVTLVTNALLENIDKGLLTDLIFLDLSKAFDSLDHSIMLDKLTSLGMNRTICAPKVFAQTRSCMSARLYLSGSSRVAYLARYYLSSI